jgi:hypothetical protein
MAWLSKRRSHWMESGNKNSGVSFARYGYVRLPVTRDTVEVDEVSLNVR